MKVSEDQMRAMVDAFLLWRLPQSFGPDCFVTFDRERAKANQSWPVGTNLLTYTEAREMLEHVLSACTGADTARHGQDDHAGSPAPSALPLFAVGVAQRKWESLQADGYRMQRIEFARSIEGQEKRGTIDPWGKVLWSAPSAQSSKAALSDGEIHRIWMETPARPTLAEEVLAFGHTLLARAGITPQAGKESGDV